MLTKKRYILIKNSKNSKNKKKAFKLKKVKNRTKKKSIIGNNFWSFNKTISKKIKKK